MKRIEVSWVKDTRKALGMDDIKSRRYLWRRRKVGR